MRVLIVDDYPDMAESLAQILAAQGHEVRTALSPRNAAVALDGFVPDAAILDLALPEMDGFEVAKNLCKSLDKRPLLIAMTGHAKLEERSRSEGFDYHFLKPVDALHLISILESHANSQSLVRTLPIITGSQ